MPLMPLMLPSPHLYSYMTSSSVVRFLFFHRRRRRLSLPSLSLPWWAYYLWLCTMKNANAIYIHIINCGACDADEPERRVEIRDFSYSALWLLLCRMATAWREWMASVNRAVALMKYKNKSQIDINLTVENAYHCSVDVAVPWMFSTATAHYLCFRLSFALIHIFFHSLSCLLFI